MISLEWYDFMDVTGNYFIFLFLLYNYIVKIGKHFLLLLLTKQKTISFKTFNNCLGIPLRH